MHRFILLGAVVLLQFGKLEAQNENTLTSTEKAFGLSLIWKECSYNYAFFDRAPTLNWDSCYRSYLPAVLNTETDWQYYQVLQNFISNLKDGHTCVYPPVYLREKLFASANQIIRTRLINDRVMIEEVCSDSLLKSGLTGGMEIISVDGMEVHQYARENVVPYICASTKQNFEYQTYTLYLLNGELSRSVKIMTKDTDGIVKEFTVRREKWLRESTPYEGIPLYYDTLIGNVGYLKIKHFIGGDSFRKQFDSIYCKILETEALVIDIRQNFGGSSDNAWYVLRHLIDTVFQTPSWKSPMYIAAHKSWGMKDEWFNGDGAALEPMPGILIYKKPVYLLIDESTFSAAEDFSAIFKASKRGMLMGRKTAGSTGNSVLLKLPANGFAGICAKHDYFKELPEYEGFGVIPDKEINYEISALSGEHDTILNKTLNFINK